jgi:cell division protein FtsB
VRRRRFRLPAEITLPGAEDHGDAIPKEEAKRRKREEAVERGGRRQRLPERLRRRAAWLIFGLVFVSGGMAALFGERGYFDVRGEAANARRLERDVAALRESVADLRAEIDGLRGNSSEIERLAREQLGMARRDEVVFVLPDEEREALEPLKTD